MYIYADESGNTGRYIFHDPPIYRQGAILSKEDMGVVLNHVVEHYCKKLNVPYLHANELLPHITGQIAETVLTELEGAAWIFHETIIQKSYLATTKFVDSIYDSGENLAVPFHWYNVDLLRHSLCCFFDDFLDEIDKRMFWDAYLKDDYSFLKILLSEFIKKLDREFNHIDKRLYEVVYEGLNFALLYTEQITLMAAVKKNSYKGHTPNMVAFISLMNAVRKFCRENKVIPKKFFHDRTSEFEKTMEEYHKLYSGVEVLENEKGLWPKSKRADFDLGEFSIVSSREISTMQVVDILLWLTQREKQDDFEDLKQQLFENTDSFYISRAMSEMIVAMWLAKIYDKQMTAEEFEKGKDILKDLENTRLERLKKFSEEENE